MIDDFVNLFVCYILHFDMFRFQRFQFWDQDAPFLTTFHYCWKMFSCFDKNERFRSCLGVGKKADTVTRKGSKEYCWNEVRMSPMFYEYTYVLFCLNGLFWYIWYGSRDNMSTVPRRTAIMFFVCLLKPKCFKRVLLKYIF